MNVAQNVAQHLLKIEAVRLQPNQPFTWASGWKSPIYCDNRKILSFPESRTVVKNGFVEKAKTWKEYDVIAGVATSGIPWGAMVADALEMPFIYVRSKPKGHGMQNMIEGKLEKGARVLVIEDLISTGGSGLKAVEAVRAAGGDVVGVLAIFTYNFPIAKENFANAKCDLATLSNYETLVELAVAQKYVAAEDLELLQSWRKSPSTWKQ